MGLGCLAAFTSVTPANSPHNNTTHCREDQIAIHSRSISLHKHIDTYSYSYDVLGRCVSTLQANLLAAPLTSCSIVGFKKNVNRATTQVMMKTGHVEKTNDRDYEVEERRYRTMEAASMRLQKEAKGYLDSLRGEHGSIGEEKDRD